MIFNLKKARKKIEKKIEILFLVILVIITIIITSFYNSNKKQLNKNYKDLIYNTYFQKTINYIFNNLTPRYKSVNHRVSKGETFDKILDSYLVESDEIIKIKNELSSDYNLNNLKTNLNIKFTLDESNNKRITSFILPISRTKKIQLTRNLETDLFDKTIIITNLNKKIIFKEGKIKQSLYKTAIELKVQPNIIVEFARIYGFQVDFQRDLRKNDNFQIMYEVFEDDNGKIFETGNIVFTNLKLSGMNNALYYFDKEVVKVIMIKMVRA